MGESEDELYTEKLPNVTGAVKKKAQECCSMKTVSRLLPIINWLPEYRVKLMLDDFVAGLTVGLTTIPQAIANAAIGGLPPQYGLYSSFMGCFVYIFFGTCKDITVGPTALMALMVQAHVVGSPDFAVLSCFLSGCVILLLGLLNLGVLVQFISIPVTTAFTMAAAITIASGQINNLFGIQSSSNEFLASWETFFGHIAETKLNDCILGLCTLVVLLLMRKIKDIRSPYPNLLKYISLSRNALAVIVGILLSYLLSHDDYTPFRVSGEIVPGIPPFTLPPFSTTVNGTTVGFGEMVSGLGASLASIPLISILESIAVAKAFSKGKTLDATQEMIALGLCNILGSFVSSMPITGSFTRTAINNSSGVKTTLGGAVTGILVLMALAFLTETFYYIPKASLAAIIICAMIFMVEYDRIAEIWRSKKLDMFPFLVTVICCLFWSLEYGIVCGIVVNIIFLLYKTMKPKISISIEKVCGSEVCLVDISGSIGYSAAEYLKSKVLAFVSSQCNGIFLVIIRGEEITSIDSTVALTICSLKEDLTAMNCELICWDWNLATAGVICRLNNKARYMFKFNKNLQDLLLSRIPIITDEKNTIK